MKKWLKALGIIFVIFTHTNIYAIYVNIKYGQDVIFYKCRQDVIFYGKSRVPWLSKRTRLTSQSDAWPRDNVASIMRTYIWNDKLECAKEAICERALFFVLPSHGVHVNNEPRLLSLQGCRSLDKICTVTWHHCQIQTVRSLALSQRWTRSALVISYKVLGGPNGQT